MPPLAKDEVLERLKDNQPGKPPFWNTEIGDINLSGHVFQHPVNFEGASFTGVASFTEVEFLGKANFKGAVFQQGASFFGSTFHDDVNFNWSQFISRAYFWRVHFLGHATFMQMVVKPSSQPQLGYLDPGESNFSWAFFSGRTDFYRAHFHGATYFWRTVFCTEVNFAEAKFEAGVCFEGVEHEVCIARRDFKPEPLFDLLLRQGIITLDGETEGHNDYAHFVGITTHEELSRRLESEGYQPEQVDKVKGVWVRYAKNMFCESETVSFVNAGFQAPNDSQFIGVNLEKCLFTGSNIGKVDFTNVRWDKRPTFLLGKRCSVHDERHVRDKGNYDLVGKLYHELRKNHEDKGRYEEAGNFYYGEMEMKRLAQPGVLKFISLTAIYKYLSGYGEQHVLALLWLALAIFLFFPALYLVSGVVDDSVKAVLHSLEVSTFLKGNSETTEMIFGRFMEGFQRIIVPLQAGLFVLAIKRKYERK